MAYVAQDDEEEQQQGGQPQQQGAERVLTPESSVVNAGQGGGAAAGAAGQNQKKASGTGWTNLQRYVDANEGADERMGGQIRGAMDTSANNVRSTEDSYRTDAQQNVQAARRDDNGVIASLKSNPMSVKKEDYQKQASDAWDGYYSANQAQGFGQAEQGVQKQAQRAANLNDFSKRQGEMAEIYGKGEGGNQVRYTGGEQRLDTFLIGAGQGGQKALADINTVYGQGGNFASGWENLVKQVQGDIDAGQTARKATAAATKAAQAEAVAARDAKFKEAEKQLAADRAFAQQSTDSARSSARGGANGFKDQLLRQAGLDPASKDAQAISGEELASLIKMSGQKGLGDVVNADDLASYQALLDLEGQSYDANRFAKTGNKGGTYDVDLQGLTGLFGQKTAARVAEEARIKKEAADRAAANNYGGNIGGLDYKIPQGSDETAPPPAKQEQKDLVDKIVDVHLPGAPKKAKDEVAKVGRKIPGVGR